MHAHIVGRQDDFLKILVNVPLRLCFLQYSLFELNGSTQLDDFLFIITGYLLLFFLSFHPYLVENKNLIHQLLSLFANTLQLLLQTFVSG